MKNDKEIGAQALLPVIARSDSFLTRMYFLVKLFLRCVLLPVTVHEKWLACGHEMSQMGTQKIRE